MLDDFKVFIHVFTWECISKQIILANYENVWCGIIRLLWIRLGDFYKYVWHILTRDSTNSYLNLLYVLQTYDPFNLVKFTFVQNCIKNLIPTVYYNFYQQNSWEDITLFYLYSCCLTYGSLIYLSDFVLKILLSIKVSLWEFFKSTLIWILNSYLRGPVTCSK